ncbi:MAG: CDC27 family protein [Pseudomonadota bacterium]
MLCRYRLDGVFTRVLLMCLVLVFPSVSEAREQTLSRSIYAELMQIRKLMDVDANRAAVKRLRTLNDSNTARAYELAVIQQYLGYAHLALDESHEAIQAFQGALKARILPEKVSQTLNYLVAQLYIQIEDYRAAVGYLKQWFSIEVQPKPQAHVLAAHAYYSLQRYPEAVRHLKQALAKADSLKASWYQLLAAIYRVQYRFTELESLLHEAIRRYPGNAIFWYALADLHLEQHHEGRALSTLMLAYRQGVIKPLDLPRVARLYVHLGIPEKAARLIEDWQQQGLLPLTYDNLMLQAQGWLVAREPNRAIQALQKASRLTRDGAPNLLMAKLYFDQQHWSDARKQAQRALQKGGLDDPAEARFLLALAAFHDGESTLASTILKGLRGDTRLGEQAQAWLRRIKIHQQ